MSVVWATLNLTKTKCRLLQVFTWINPRPDGVFEAYNHFRKKTFHSMRFLPVPYYPASHISHGGGKLELHDFSILYLLRKVSNSPFHENLKLGNLLFLSFGNIFSGLS